MKGCEALAQWIEPIRNHFWHCAETCDGDVTKLKVGNLSQIIGIMYVNILATTFVTSCWEGLSMNRILVRFYSSCLNMPS